ncbi:hypothetical protein M222_1450 [Enterococcus faecalis AZ19]|uniref:hypothetical protein n=1 Tax=Enterococcus faecalis TaxID=1351 RepID=UPI00045A2AA5|nr:hypothetical protein [Enterococcus faecalis]EHB6470536.1 hypothetical protein [Enterococcus faecalis]KAJ74459.1 hypothetical protein M222_1450 [Enterococcus faecalis AZ19]
MNTQIDPEKKKIQHLRQHLVYLMALNDNWYKYPESNLYKEIVTYGKELGKTDSHRKLDQIKKDDYLNLRKLGYTLHEIAEHYAISPPQLTAWRLKHNIKG